MRFRFINGRLGRGNFHQILDVFPLGSGRVRLESCDCIGLSESARDISECSAEEAIDAARAFAGSDCDGPCCDGHTVPWDWLAEQLYIYDPALAEFNPGEHFKRASRRSR